MDKAITKSTIQNAQDYRENVVFAICLIFVSLFSYTAYSKLTAHQAFLNGLSHVELIGPYATYISWAVPVSEILTAVLLIIPKTNRQGLYAFLILMGTFTIYIISVLAWAKVLPCSCGGVIEKLTWSQHVWFNLVFIALGIYALWLIKKSKLKI